MVLCHGIDNIDNIKTIPGHVRDGGIDMEIGKLEMEMGNRLLMPTLPVPQRISITYTIYRDKRLILWHCSMLNILITTPMGTLCPYVGLLTWICKKCPIEFYEKPFDFIEFFIKNCPKSDMLSRNWTHLDTLKSCKSLILKDFANWHGSCTMNGMTQLEAAH